MLYPTELRAPNDKHLSENSVVDRRASHFSPGNNGDLSTVALAKAEASDVYSIVDAAVYSHVEKKGADRSQIEYSDRA